MKQVLCFFLLLPLVAVSQTVTIPDANFKAKLIQLGVDTNADGAIQVTEAEAVNSLDLMESSIIDLTGIEYFVNLTYLNCYSNDITTLNLSSLISLETLSVNGNSITSLNLNGLTNLHTLDTSGNPLVTLDLSGLNALQEVTCSACSLVTLNVSNLVNLTTLDCSGNQLTELNLGGLVNLTQLWCGQNPLGNLDVHEQINLTHLDCNTAQLTSLDLSGLTQLKNLYCMQNQISTLDLSQSNNIEYLECYSNLLTTLDISNLTGLLEINCDLNQISVLDLSGLTALTRVSCFNNTITQLDLTDQHNLIELQASTNNLTTLDISNCVNLNSLDCSFNQLQTVFIKNGVNEGFVNLEGNSGLQYVCCDEGQVLPLKTQLISWGLTSTECNTYCSFVPGGSYNRINGKIRLDIDNNGCDASDFETSFVKLRVTDTSLNEKTFSTVDGTYNFYTLSGTFLVQPEIENAGFFNVPVASPIIFTDNNNNVFVQDFCLTPNGIHPDVEVILNPITNPIPGSDINYQLVFKNKGNQVLSGTYSITYDDSILDFINSSDLPLQISTGLVEWNYTNLMPFERRVINLTLHLNSDADSPPVLVGDTFFINVAILPIDTDEIPDDNTFTLKQVAQNATALNSITCLEGDSVSTDMIGHYFHYFIDFENTGGATVSNVVIRIDVNDADFDVNTIELLNASHIAYVRQVGTRIEIVFDGCQIDTGGHGNVLLKIKSKDNLTQGDAVDKQAEIYFDYNSPWPTNVAETVFLVNGNPGENLDSSIVVYPNPDKSTLTVSATTAIKTIMVYDVWGRLLETHLVDDSLYRLDLNERSSGIYFIKVFSERGYSVQKIVKE